MIVIVGGGISGLAAAYALRNTTDAAGHSVEVVVVDAAADVGGKLRVSEIAGVMVDEGAETFLVRAPEGRDLVEACGLGDQLVNPVTAGATVWAHGRFVPLPQRTVMGVPSSLRSLRGVLTTAEIARAGLDRVLPGVPPGNADVAVGAWLRQRMGSAVVDLLVDPLLGGVYAGHADELSLQAAMPMLDRHHRSALAAAAASLPAQGDPTQPVFATMPAGLGSLPHAVLDASGARLVSQCVVRRIERTSTGWRVVHGPTTDEKSIEADGVIIAVPPAAAGRLLGSIAAGAAGEMSAIESASVAIITTAWRRADAGPMPGSGYLVPSASSPRRPVKAVTFSSAKWKHLASDDVAIVRCSIGRHREVVDLQRDDDALAAFAAAELTEHAGFRGRPIASRVSRWGGGLPQPAVGHRDRVARIRADLAAVKGLAVCGAAIEGVGIPACIRSGRLAAEKVLADLVVSGRSITTP